MIIGVGIDIVKLKHFQTKMNKGGENFIKKVFSPVECECAQKLSEARRIGFFAKRYAAKEAFVKALGTGLGIIGLQDIWVENKSSGQPVVVLSSRAKKCLKEKYKHPVHIHVSLSDDEDAIAIIVVEKA